VKNQNTWQPCSGVTVWALKREIAVFLRTHRNGVEQLREMLRSIPADRTEADFFVARGEHFVARSKAKRDAQIAGAR
jgi:hypothetical protein